MGHLVSVEGSNIYGFILYMFGFFNFFLKLTFALHLEKAEVLDVLHTVHGIHYTRFVVGFYGVVIRPCLH